MTTATIVTAIPRTIGSTCHTDDATTPSAASESTTSPCIRRPKRLSLTAEQQPDHRFDDLFSLICREDWLMLAHDHVAGNAGSKTAGCDGINLRVFDEDLEDNLKKLRESLKDGTFRPSPVRRVFIPKSSGRLRPLGIPSIRDRA